MNISILIPQLFYDLIGRIIPGIALIASAFLLFRGRTGLHDLTNWSPSSVYVILGDLLASHIVGSLIGAIWFRVYRLSLLNDPIDADTGIPRCKHGWKKSWLHGWAKCGENRMDEAFTEIYKNKVDFPKLGSLKMGDMSPTGRIALIYDYVQLCCPKACSRIAKLRAEEHMSGVLMIGYFILAVTIVFSPSSVSSSWPSWWKVEAILGLAALTAGWLAWHLEKRSGAALFFTWFLVHSKIVEEDCSIN
jgi:hypothetical protein